MFSKLHRRSKLIPADEIQRKIDELAELYVPMDLNHAHHDKKKLALKKLTAILTNANRHDLQTAEIESLLHCSLTLLYYFGMKIKFSKLTSRYWYWCSKRQFVKSESAFQKTMDGLLPERYAITIQITLQFFTEVHLWPYESFVCQILEIVLYYSRGGIALFNMMLTDLHVVLAGDVTNARHRMRVLYELLKSDNWIIDKQRLLPFVTRLLDFFAYSIAKGNSKMSGYKYLRKGFEVCLRRIFERAENHHRLTIIITMLNWFSMVVMNDDNVLDFSLLLEYAAELYQVGAYNNSFCEGLLEHVLEDLVGSPNPLYSLIGCRLLQKMLDRNQNANFMLLPTIYYEFSQVALKVGQYESSDKSFVRHNRDIIHNTILTAITYHCTSAVNIKALATIVSVIILEVPCGLTAAAAACLLMAIQDYALNGENIPAVSRYWLHAIVISTMSLICWVHKAPVLYRYVNQIIARRAKEAPQLNPPLMESYNLLNHHVTWNKPTLFFEDWELRYGLWKHFQDSPFLWGLAVLILMISMAESRSKKVVIHVPFKLKKIKHTHTVYKTIHHHHGVRDHNDHLDHHEHGPSMLHETHLPPATEDHEHFHHMHLRDEPQAGRHTQPIPGIGIPEFLPDVPMDPDDMAHDMSLGRRIPMFRRAGPDDE